MDKYNLPHIIGLHKLINIDILRRLANKTVSATQVYRNIKNGTYAPETLLVQNNDYYTNNQIELDVNRLTIKRRGSVVQVFDYKKIDSEFAIDKSED